MDIFQIFLFHINFTLCCIIDGPVHTTSCFAG